jgi:hypothetical protein
VKINTNLKRLIREYEFLLDDIDDVLEIHKTANQELNRAIRMAKDDDIAESEFEKEEEEEDEVETFEDTPERKVLKKLFRKIVFKCHPDRLPTGTSESEKAKMQDLYEKAVLAHDRDNWGLMVVVAIKLDIKLPKEAEDMVGRISEETEGLKNQITQLTNSFAWQWYHAQDEIQKKMVNDYLNTLKKIKEKNAIEKRKEKKILIIGHPRTGTGYTAKLLQSWGLDVQHEKMGKDGTSDWSLASGDKSIWQDVNFKDYEWDIIIYCIRDPKESIASIAYTEDINNISLSHREKWAKFKRDNNRLVTAIVSLTSWNSMIMKLEPDFIFKVEDEQQNLFNFLKKRGFKVKKSKNIVPTDYNSRKHSNIDSLIEECGYILIRYKNRLNEYCDTHSYSHVF